MRPTLLAVALFSALPLHTQLDAAKPHHYILFTPGAKAGMFTAGDGQPRRRASRRERDEPGPAPAQAHLSFAMSQPIPVSEVRLVAGPPACVPAAK